MPRRFKEPVIKVRELASCGQTFLTKYPNRQRYCPGSKCRSAAFDEARRVEDKDEFAREVIRRYERDRRRGWRASRKEEVRV